jgi:hypothetical protein
MQYVKDASFNEPGGYRFVFERTKVLNKNGELKQMSHWVIDWSNRQTAKMRRSTYHDVKYVNEHGEHQFLFNQLVVPPHKAENK